MPRTSNYEIPRNINGAIKVIRGLDEAALVSPGHGWGTGERVCPLAHLYVTWGNGNWTVKTKEIDADLFPDCPQLIRDHLIYLYDSSRSKAEGKDKVLKFLIRYRDDLPAAIAEASKVALEDADNLGDL